MPEPKPPDLDDDFNPIQPPDLDDNLKPVGRSLYSHVFDAPEFITSGASKFAQSLTPGPTPSGGIFDALGALPDVARGMINEPVATMKGFLGGATEGAASLASPANIVTAGRGRLPQLANQILGGAQAIHGGSEIMGGNIGQGLAEIGFGGLGVKAGISGPSGRKVPSALPEKPITAESMPEGFFHKEPTLGTPEIPKPKPTMQTAPLGQTILIRKEGASPEIVKRAKEAGFEFLGLNDQGNFRFKKTSEGIQQPLLESEVGLTRPTKAQAEGQLGPKTDIVKTSPLAETFNLPRALKASMDLSAPLRQGLPLIHKKEFWTSVRPMLDAWRSEDAFRASQNDIANRPLFRKRMAASGKQIKELPSFAEDAGLHLTDLTDLSKREEALMSTWAEKVPGVRRSNRAYTAFLNNLRADTFESLVRDGKVFGADAEANLPLARALADFVNTASGRGKLPGNLEQSAVTLNSLFFSPRLIASRLKMLNPAYYVMAPPQVRKEALKSLFAIAATGNAITQLGKMGGGEVSMDPSSSDFGKLKIGNTRIDPYGGFQQYIVAANRLLNPASQSTTGADTPFTRGQQITSTRTGKEYDLWNPQGPYDPTWGSAAARFGRGKLHPTIGFAIDLATGMKDITGKPFDFTTTNPMENTLVQQFTPILLGDLYELAQQSPELLPIAGPLSTFGMTVQSYGE